LSNLNETRISCTPVNDDQLWLSYKPLLPLFRQFFESFWGLKLDGVKLMPKLKLNLKPKTDTYNMASRTNFVCTILHYFDIYPTPALKMKMKSELELGLEMEMELKLEMHNTNKRS